MGAPAALSAAASMVAAGAASFLAGGAGIFQASPACWTPSGHPGLLGPASTSGLSICPYSC